MTTTIFCQSICRIRFSLPQAADSTAPHEGINSSASMYSILLKKSFAPPVLYLRFPQHFANLYENYLSLLIKLFSDDC